jgi:dynein heavy chain, axonemal
MPCRWLFQMQTDFGLRNVLTVLRMLSVEKRNLKSLDAELPLVGRVLCHVNVSKVAHKDEGLFLSMVNEVFPGVSLIQTFDQIEVEQAVFNAVDNLHLVNYKLWTRKVMQVCYLLFNY